MAEILRTILLFVLAGLAEIGGGWLVWQWLREGRGLALGLLGGRWLGIRARTAQGLASALGYTANRMACQDVTARAGRAPVVALALGGLVMFG